uniref:Uncharacterized protein n=1 Tax=Alsidium seaforthii TaxID=2007182 RepID=A0A1Z1MD77_9FLOR|nr:hypothetical protein [Bryothamnion seaforthii]ARW63970.1 hypothetical protein [Bryothamnion seaforthii]
MYLSILILIFKGITLIFTELFFTHLLLFLLFINLVPSLLNC